MNGIQLRVGGIEKGAERLQSQVKKEAIGGTEDIWHRRETTQEGHDICLKIF